MKGWLLNPVFVMFSLCPLLENLASNCDIIPADGHFGSINYTITWVRGFIWRCNICAISLCNLSVIVGQVAPSKSVWFVMRSKHTDQVFQRISLHACPRQRSSPDFQIGLQIQHTTVAFHWPVTFIIVCGMHPVEGVILSTGHNRGILACPTWSPWPRWEGHLVSCARVGNVKLVGSLVIFTGKGSSSVEWRYLFPSPPIH